MKHPRMLNEISIEELQEWVREFPYSQNLRILLAQKIKMDGGDDKADEVVDAAMYATDRQHLHHTLHSDFSVKEEGSDGAGEESSQTEKATELSSTGMGLSALPDTNNGEGKEQFVQDPAVNGGVESPSAIIHEEEVNESDEEVEVDLDDKNRVRDDEFVANQEGSEVEDPQEIEDPAWEEAEVNTDHEENGHAGDELEEAAGTAQNQYTHHEAGLADAGSPTSLSSFSKWLLTLPGISDHDTKAIKKADEGNIGLAGKDLISTSLAELLTAQGHYKEAISMYEKLQLKYPEKSAYFAAQIEKLKAS